MKRKWVRRLTARLAGLLMGCGIAMSCSKGVIVSRWYEPRGVLTYQTTYARMAGLDHMYHEYDDEDFCIAFQRKHSLDTLYLPYKFWQTVHINDTLRLRTKFYSDWNIKE